MLPRTALTLPLLLAACSSYPSEPYGSDEHPRVDPRDLRCVVVLSHDGPGTGSGVVLRPDRLLTARHVVEAFTDDLDAEFRLRIGFDWHRARIVARGPEHTLEDDWALVDVAPPLDPEKAPSAAVLAAATEPGYHPKPRQEILLAGYATRFYPNRIVDPRLPVPLVVTRYVSTDLKRGDSPPSWVLQDRSLDLEGMSGGGAFVCDATTGGPMLVGVFVAQSRDSSSLEGPLGISIPMSSSSALQVVPLPAQFCR